MQKAAECKLKWLILFSMIH